MTTTRRRPLARLAVVVLVGLVAGGGVLGSGVISVKASSGHWAVTSWLLDAVKRRSVAVRSWRIDAPNLDDASLVVRGALAYESGCSACHGTPDRPLPAVPARMTPHPPDLKRQVARWKPRELFYLVRHGVKFTGMPAWPATERDDEIWAVVAFLRALPQLDRRAYRSLTSGVMRPDASSPADANDDDDQIGVLASRCDRCHGAGGRGRLDAAIPRLAGQRAEYLQASLRAYADGRRPSGVMSPVAAALDDTSVKVLAERYAASLGVTITEPSSASAADLIYRGLPGQRVPACGGCHGRSVDDFNPLYPRLAGQPASYLVQQLRLFASGSRGGSDFGQRTHRFPRPLTEAQMWLAANYYAGAQERPR